MRDLLLQGAGAIAIVVSLIHGVLGETKIFARATIEPPRLRFLLHLVYQAGTVAWIGGGVLLVALGGQVGLHDHLLHRLRQHRRDAVERVRLAQQALLVAIEELVAQGGEGGFGIGIGDAEPGQCIGEAGIDGEAASALAPAPAGTFTSNFGEETPFCSNAPN